jgi:adenylate kinase
MRACSERYEKFRLIENLVLSIKKENLAAYIIARGVLYGNGETTFNHHFRLAWTEKPRALPYLGTGENRIPTIHVKDLAKMVKFVIENKPESRYLFGIDRTPEPTQKHLIEAISRGVGSGEVVEVEDCAEAI